MKSRTKVRLELWATRMAVLKTYNTKVMGFEQLTGELPGDSSSTAAEYAAHSCLLVVVVVLVPCPSTAWSGAAAVSQQGLGWSKWWWLLPLLLSAPARLGWGAGCRVSLWTQYMYHWGINMNIKWCLHLRVRVMQQPAVVKEAVRVSRRIDAHAHAHTRLHTPTHAAHTRTKGGCGCDKERDKRHEMRVVRWLTILQQQTEQKAKKKRKMKNCEAWIVLHRKRKHKNTSTRARA